MKKIYICCNNKKVYQFDSTKEAKDFLKNDTYNKETFETLLGHSDFFCCYGGLKEATEYLKKGWHGCFFARNKFYKN